MRRPRNDTAPVSLYHPPPMARPSDPTRPTPKAGPVPPVAVVVSRYNASITDRLRQGALEQYALRAGGRATATVLDAPGSFEIPAIVLAAARSGRFAGVVALGCIIKGETSHDVYLAEAVTRGLMEVVLRTGVPVGLGVLTVDTVAQARARAGGQQGNKGAEAMAAVLDTIAEIGAVRTRSGSAGGDNGPARWTRAVPDKAARKVRR